MNPIDSIAVKAAEKHLPFLVAGGHAVMTHGYGRNTFDIDLIIRETDRESWSRLVVEMGYTFHSDGPTFVQFNPPNELMLPIDLMLMNEATFIRLVADAVSTPDSREGVKAVSLLHLLALKCHAVKNAHEGRIVKDANDVIQLVQINRLDLNRPEIREIFLKYGTADLYEKVRRISKY